MNEKTLELKQPESPAVKYVYVDTLLPDNLMDLYTRCVGYKVRNGADLLERPSFVERREMLKVY